MPTFTELHDRLQCLLDASRHDDEANDALDSVGVQSVREYAKWHPKEIEGFSTCELRDDSILSAILIRQLVALWHGVCEDLAQCAYVIPPRFGGCVVEGECVVTDSPDAKLIRTAIKAYPPVRWRQRAEDYMTALSYLSELAGEG